MKSIKILIILFLLPVLVLAKDVVKGSVLDYNKQPLIGVNIHWQNEKGGVVSDDLGRFEIKGVPHKNHMLVFAYVGFDEKVVHIDDFSKEITVILDENKELNEVVIEKTVPRSTLLIYGSAPDSMTRQQPLLVIV